MNAGVKASACSRRRILFPFRGGVAGGSHVSALMLAARLDRRRFEPVVALHSAGGALDALVAEAGFDPLLLPEACSAVGRIDLLRRLPARAAFLRDQRIDLVHTNDGVMHAAWGLAARMAGKPLLWHHRQHPEALGLRWLAPLVADRVVAVSRFAAPKAGLWSAANRCTVIHSPFDIRETIKDRAANERERRAQLGVQPDCFLVGYFGHLSDRKRPIAFVDAIAAHVRLAPQRPILGLMFGDVLDPGLDAAVVARAETLGVAEHVRLMGFQRPVAPWLAACDLHLVTAVDEPFGRTLIEAMLAGIPVVATRSGGNIEAIDDGVTGLLVPPDDAEAAACAMIRLHDRDLAVTMSARARDVAHKRFGIEAHVEAVEAIYEQLISR